MNTMDKEIEYILSALKEDGYGSELPNLKLRAAKKGKFIVADYEKTEPVLNVNLRTIDYDGYEERTFTFAETITVHPDLDTTVLEVVDFLEFCQKEIMQSFE
jgi:hypothetical protein